MTADRERTDSFKRLATIPRGSGAPASDTGD